MAMQHGLHEYEGEDAFKILLATDIHLGYNEKDQIRGEDSFIAFEEILKIAVKEDVDFILLGGDLFHDSKPSPYSIQKCSELIRKYCFGDRGVAIEFLSDQSTHFQHLVNPVVNYEDPNINVSIPIFSIHGNHDDPTGTKSISAIDLLATNGLINYFGRWTDLTKVEVTPIILRKGESTLALFGLSHIHDQRLARLFRDGKVRIKRIEEDDWFNLLVLHQNRVHRGANNFIPHTSLPDFMDLVVWGHEHDCLIVPEKMNNGVWITQPGSSVATSLSEGESLPKHVGVLVIKKKEFYLNAIPLQTVRPFVFETFDIEDPALLAAPYDIDNLHKLSMKVVSEKIEEIIKRITKERKAKNLKEMLPLIRIVVRYYNDEQCFNGIKLGQNFVGRVANPDDMILQKKMKEKTERRKGLPTDCDDETDEQEEGILMADLVLREFERNKCKDEMKVLSINGLNRALQRFIMSKDTNALKDIIDYQVEKTVEKLIEMEVTVENVDRGIDLLYQKRMEVNEEIEALEINKVLDNPARVVERALDEDLEEAADDDDSANSSIDNDTTSKRGRGRGRGRGRAAAATTTTRKPRGSRGRGGAK